MIVPGYEERTFECSGCHDHVRRLVFVPRAIGPLSSERMRLPPASFKAQNKHVTTKGAWARAVRAAPQMKSRYVFGLLVLSALAVPVITSGQGPKGPMGDQGPPGVKGPRGDPGPGSGIRVVRATCDETNCALECGENEMLLTAYCGPKRTSAITPTERTATCGNRGPANSPLVGVCAQMASP